MLDGVEVPGAERDLANALNRIAELQGAVSARDRFIAAVGHELRNVMSPLALLAESFTSPPEAAIFERRMQMLSRNLQRLTSTLDRVGEVAQLRSEKLALTPEPVELSALVREVVAELGAEADAAGVQLHVEARTDVTGSWDRRRLRQIVSHLVANAIRHSGGGPVQIALTAADGHAVLAVADRGRGIEAGRRPHLFDAFDVADTRTKGGLGVGLWVVRTLCQHLGGAVSLVDDHAPGACFRVVLPRV